MSTQSIIVEPKQMFNSLQELQHLTTHMIVVMYGLESTLQSLATMTYAVGFGDLMKKAETSINQIGTAVVATNNAFNNACKDVVNQLVDKFAAEGAKSDYSAPKFGGVKLHVNLAHRAAIYPAQMEKLFEELQSRMNGFGETSASMMQEYSQTKSFWVGTAADRTRDGFFKKVVPHFSEFDKVMFSIHLKCKEWLDEASRFEAALGVQ